MDGPEATMDNDDAGQFYASRGQIKTEWTKTPPTKSGIYWHWNGEDFPLPMFVGWSGCAGKCFVQIGQLGITEPVYVQDYGGWWCEAYWPRLPEGTVPNV